MENEKLKNFLAELFEPVKEQLVETVYDFTVNVFNKLPATMSADEKFKIVEPLIAAQRDAVINSIKSIKPEDIAAKLKEEPNGGR